MSNWKPIETAPKNREILLWLPYIKGIQENKPYWVKSSWLKFFKCWSNEFNNGPGYSITFVLNPHTKIQEPQYNLIQPSHWLDLTPPSEV